MSAIKPGPVAELLDLLRSCHERLTRQLSDVGRRAFRDGEAATTPRFGFFAATLQRHIDVEQQWLFPLLTVAGEETQTLREDHGRITRSLARAGSQLESGDLPEFAETAQELLYALSAHCIREERMIAGRADAILTHAESVLMVKLLASLDC